MTQIKRYTKDFLSYSSGYINNPETMNPEFCEYCLYKSGNEFLDTLDWTVDHRWRNFGIIVGYLLFNLILSTILVYLFRKQKR